MKLNRTVTPVQRGGVKTESTFTIQTSAHAFEILSSGLYTDSVTAIVRELSCNAYDSHVDAGKRDVPFDMHVPTKMEPWFSIRDYGTGLSNEDVLSVYTTYFQSTKANSDDFIGALGLGSKSPFAYASDFQVTSFFDGVEYKYAIFLNENGVPSVALMGEAVTDQINGVEVRIPSEDRRRFTDAISRYLAYFDVKPNLLGIDKVDAEKMYTDVRQPAGSELDEAGKWFVADKDRGYYSARTGIVYGQVPYPANVDQIISGTSELCTAEERAFYRTFSDQLVMIFAVGDLSITANREELKYDEQTLAAIAGRITEFHAKFFTGVKKAIENFADNDSLYKTNRYLMTEVFNDEARFFKSLDFEQIDCNAFKVLQSHKSNWGNGYSLLVKEALKDVKLFDPSKLETFRSQTTGDIKVRNPKGGSFECLGISSEVIYYVIDEPKNAIAKAKQHFLATKDEHPRATFILLKPRELRKCADAAHQTQIEEMRVALGKPDFIYTSTLEYTKPIRQKSTTSRKQVGTVFDGAPHWYCKSDFDIEDGGIYIYLAGGTKIYKGSKAVPENDIFQHYGRQEGFYESLVSVYNEVHGTEYARKDLIGVSAADIKMFDSSSDWTNILDTIETYVKANQVTMQQERHKYDTIRHSISQVGHNCDSDCAQLVRTLADCLRAGDVRADMIETLGPDNTILPLLKEYNTISNSLQELKEVAGGHEPLLAVFADNMYKSTTSHDNRYLVDLDGRIDEIAKQYPIMNMLPRYCGLHEEKELQKLLDYIIMVDNTNTTNNTTGNP